jgi:hypothetical protein
MEGEPKTIRLWQEIALALVLKATALALIWLAWFSSPADHAVDASKMTSHFFSQPPDRSSP